MDVAHSGDADHAWCRHWRYPPNIPGHTTELSRCLALLLHLSACAMAYQSTLDDTGRDTNTFYRRTLHVLSDAHVPFLVGGSHAYLQYTGIVRDTKDFDLFIRKEDLQRALDGLRDAGYRTEITFSHWLAKAYQAGDHVDLVFSSGNGVCQ